MQEGDTSGETGIEEIGEDMAEELKALIEKIQQEGVDAAREKAVKIEEEARRNAEAITAKAKKDADSMLSKAKEEIARTEEGSKASLKQAGRDLILNLRKEIASALDKIILSKVREGLTHDDMAKMLAALIKGAGAKVQDGTIVSLNKEDLEKVEKALFSELGASLKKGVTLSSSEEIHAGFRISYDAGKSYYDFTDQALAEYLAGYVKPQLVQALKG